MKITCLQILAVRHTSADLEYRTLPVSFLPVSFIELIKVMFFMGIVGKTELGLQFKQSFVAHAADLLCEISDLMVQRC